MSTTTITPALIAHIDFAAMALASKSHDADELRAGVERGDAIWSFDSGSSGHDDILIEDADRWQDEIMDDLECHFETGEYADPPERSAFDRSQPNPWTLERLTMEEMAGRWPVED